MATQSPASRGRVDLPDVSVETHATALTAGLLLGFGLGGFIDGIVLHQILQWHNMGSAIVPPTTMDAMSQNMRWDGLFHLATWLLTVAGVMVLWLEGRRGTAPPVSRVLVGQMLLGWGVFNLVEGVVDHLLLGIHHVRDVPMHVPAYDWVFLGVGGVGLIAVGWLLSRSDAR